MKQLTLICIAPLMICILSACSSTHDKQAESPATISILSDRQDSDYETLFIIRNRTMLIARHRFPLQPSDFSELHLIGDLPDEDFARLHRWVVSNGDIEPPFVPSGPWRARIDVSFDGQERLDTVWFDDENEQIAADLTALAERYRKDNYRFPAPPQWVRDSDVLQAFIQLE